MEQAWALRRMATDQTTHIYWTGEFRRRVPVVAKRPDRAQRIDSEEVAEQARRDDPSGHLLAFEPVALSEAVWKRLRVWSSFDAIGPKAIAATSQSSAARHLAIPLSRFRAEWRPCEADDLASPALEQPCVLVRSGVQV